MRSVGVAASNAWHLERLMSVIPTSPPRLKNCWLFGGGTGDLLGFPGFPRQLLKRHLML